MAARQEPGSHSEMISALLVNHNGWHLLEPCVERLLEHRAPAVDEIVVVDNASTDGSVESFRRRWPEASFPALRLLALEDNPGFGAANNRAAELARGDHFLILNTDAWLAEGALAALEERLRHDSSLAAVAPRLHYPDGRRQFHWAPATGVRGEALQKLRNRFESSAWAHREPPRWLWWLFGAPWYTAACWLARRRAFEAVGGFDEDFFLYFEDVDLCLRWREAGFDLATAERATAFHIKGGSSRGWLSELDYRRSQLRFYRLHRPGWEQTLIRRRIRHKLSTLDDPTRRAELARLLDVDSQARKTPDATDR